MTDLAAFIRIKMEKLQKQLLGVYTLVGGGGSVVLIAITPVFINDAWAKAAVPIVAVTVLLSLFGLNHVALRSVPRAAALAWVPEIGLVSLTAALLWGDLRAGRALDGMMSSTLFLAIAPVVVGVSPGGLKRSATIAALFVGLTVLVVGPWLPESAAFIILMIFAVTAGTLFKRMLIAATAAEARAELRLLSGVAPASVVRRFAGSSEPIEEMFRATVRPCVCLSSDWRGYQRLSAELSSEALASKLEAYYTMCERILLEVAPEGDYYADWIADELFVVFFDFSAAGHDLAARAFAFAERLLAEKAAFMAVHAAPRGIDIGIGGGNALIGMLGSTGFNKVTAVGATPAKVRRLQTVAKGLRKSLGETDRIVFEAEIRAAHPGARTVPAEGPTGEPERFYVEPRAG